MERRLPSLNRVRHGGFTLIELLVVIAIVAILAAILFPVFARSRENARRASCQSNLKQVGLALLQYTQDFDESLPGTWLGPVASSPWDAQSDGTRFYKWMDAAQPYARSEAVFNCPSDSQNARYKFRSPNAYGSYAMSNAYYWTGDALTAPTSDYGGSYVMKLQAPATTVWVTDGLSAVGDWKTYEFFWGSAAEGDALAIQSTSPRTFQNIVECHLETVNVLYTDGHVTDGHVKALKLGALAAKKRVNGLSILTAFTIQDD